MAASRRRTRWYLALLFHTFLLAPHLFLEKVRNYTLDSWDHRTHLRLAWIYLKREPRREAMKHIFDAIRNFIANSPRTNGKTFHETMTYFWYAEHSWKFRIGDQWWWYSFEIASQEYHHPWSPMRNFAYFFRIHMIHYAIQATVNPSNDFKGFLLLNPQLSNGGLFLEYYKKETMLNNPESRDKVVLPDIKPLPSIINSNWKVPKQVQITMSGPITDDEFLTKFEAGKLDRWDHKCMLRVIYVYLVRNGQLIVRKL